MSGFAGTAYDKRVLARLKSMFKGPQLAGPPVALQGFGASDRLTESGISTDDGGWRIEGREAGSIRLFEVAEPGVERCVLTYRAELRAADLERGAYLELWCRLPGRGEFFSKGLHQKAKGTIGWSWFEVAFNLKAEERPDLVRLNVVFEGPGTLWIRNLELLEAPLR
jgi:hypothetical protein